MGLVKIGEATYSTNWQGLCKNEPLLAAFGDYAKRNLVWESYRFLTTEFLPKRDYPLYIAEGGRFEIGLPGAVRQAMTALAEKGDWTMAAWKPHLERARKAIIGSIDSDHLQGASNKFWKSAEFAAFVRAHVVSNAREAA